MYKHYLPYRAIKVPEKKPGPNIPVEFMIYLSKCIQPTSCNR